MEIAIKILGHNKNEVMECEATVQQTNLPDRRVVKGDIFLKSNALKPYMGYDYEDGPAVGAILIFAHNSREAKKIGWRAPTFLHCSMGVEYINFRVNYLKDSEFLFKQANQEKLSNGEAHAIESPKCCIQCNMWGYELNDSGYCEDCEEDRV